MLRVKTTLIITSVILTILAAAAYSYTSLQRANDRYEAQLEAAYAHIAEREAEIQRLVLDVQSAESVTQTLLDERDRLARIEARYQASNEQLLHKLNAAQVAINELRLSDHEDVKSWANTLIPSDALRVLNNRAESCNPNSDNHDACIFGATREPYRPVHQAKF